MAEAKVIIRGYTNADSAHNSEQESTACTTTLIRDNDVIALVDLGVMNNQQVLKKALNREGLKYEDITHIFLTHSHIDHSRNTGIFPAQIPVVEFWGVWTGNKVDDWNENFSKNIKIIKTPGHSRDGLTFLVRTNKGIIAICGDVFWKENYPDDDPYANDMLELKKSREKILKIADYIIPGHGDICKVKK